VKGVTEMNRALREIIDIFPRRVEAALYAEAQIEMTEAKRRTPVDTGKLRASGRVSQPVREGRTITVTLSFGGGAITYAVIVHENLEANHDSPPFGGGQAKFLESTLNESRPYIMPRIGKRLDLNGIKS
jgi:hypothetical protein